LVLRALITAAVVVVPASGVGVAAASSRCAATPRASHPLRGFENLSTSWWVKNHVWMGIAGAFHGEGFQALPEGQKVGWYRQRPGALRIYARLLAGPPADFKSAIPCCYGDGTGFQPSGLTFGAPGCWALTAIVGGQASRFVVEVAAPPTG
jgi:hypothetical protein